MTIQAVKPPSIAVVIWSVPILSLIGFLFWVGDYGLRKEEREATSILTIESPLGFDRLSDCLSANLPLTGKGWRPVNGKLATWRRDNAARHLRIEISERGQWLRIEIFTPMGRRLRDQEDTALRDCLGSAGPG